MLALLGILREEGMDARAVLASTTGDWIFGQKEFGSADVAKFEVSLRRALSNGGSSSHPVEVASDFAFNNARISLIRWSFGPGIRGRAPTTIS
jgi:hypothetical protein